MCLFLSVCFHTAWQCTVIKISQNNNLPINYPNDLRLGVQCLASTLDHSDLEKSNLHRRERESIRDLEG